MTKYEQDRTVYLPHVVIRCPVDAPTSFSITPSNSVPFQHWPVINHSHSGEIQFYSQDAGLNLGWHLLWLPPPPPLQRACYLHPELELEGPGTFSCGSWHHLHAPPPRVGKRDKWGGSCPIHRPISACLRVVPLCNPAKLQF